MGGSLGWGITNPEGVWIPILDETDVAAFQPPNREVLGRSPDYRQMKRRSSHNV